jgi:DNA-binding MarR family transcriptional regulator
MTTSGMELTETEAVRALFDELLQFGRSLRVRSGDWGRALQGLSRADVVALGLIERDGSARPGQIAATLGVDPSVVSRQLTALDRLGLIARRTDPLDGRAERISATALGRERLQQARTAMCEVLAGRLAGWDPEAISHAASVVGDLADLLGDTPDTRDATDTVNTTSSKDTHA